MTAQELANTFPGLTSRKTVVAKIKGKPESQWPRQDYTKVWFDGSTFDAKGKPTGGDDDKLLGAAITFCQTSVGSGGNGVRELLRLVTYAYDLEVRSPLRNALVKGVEDPSKLRDKQVKAFMAERAAIGKPLSEEAARAKIALMFEE